MKPLVHWLLVSDNISLSAKKHGRQNRFLGSLFHTLARARPAVPLGLWSITSSLRGNLYVPRLLKFIKWFADNDVTHRN